jgi:four helix bundle protein
MTSKIDFIEVFKKRTKRFAIESVLFFKNLPKTEESRILGKQFLRSSTSKASNYRASCRARSKAEFFSKLSISIEEADETLFWLELFEESRIVPEKNVEPLKKEIIEILSVLSTARKNT